MNFINLYYAGGAVVVLVVLFLAYKGLFGAKFKKHSIDLMTKAQYSKLGRNALVESIAKFRKGTMDEKMVLVLANLIEKVPGLNMIYTIFPKSLVINFLYNREQNIFDLIEKPLKSGAKYNFPETTAELKEFTPLGETEIAQLTEAVKGFNEVIPTVKELKPLMDNLPTLVEVAKLFAKTETVEKGTKNNGPEKALVKNVTESTKDSNSDKTDTKSDEVVLRHTLDLESIIEESKNEEK